MTGLLFDTSPEEPEKKKARKQPAAVVAVAETEPERPPAGSFDIGPVEYLGRCDDEYQCVDESCLCGAHDVVDGAPGRWRIQCFACGTIQTVPSVPCAVEAPAESPACGEQGSFVLRGGIFDGLSLGEAWLRPRGQDYVKWAAKEHPRPAVRDACEKWLADSCITR